ncbi:MAG: hypothetical protein WDZ82_00575 [Candidatus Paceibacterota bacterium]
MQLTDEHIIEFQALYRKHFGKDISKAEALDKGSRLIRLIEITSKHEAKESVCHTSENLPD